MIRLLGLVTLGLTLVLGGCVTETTSTGVAARKSSDDVEKQLQSYIALGVGTFVIRNISARKII